MENFSQRDLHIMYVKFIKILCLNFFAIRYLHWKMHMLNPFNMIKLNNAIVVDIKKKATKNS